MALARGTARRYAEAAFEIAQRDSSMEAWLAALKVAEERLFADEVMALLSNPSIPAASRTQVLGHILGGDVIGPQLHLLTLMIRRGRFELLPAVVREFTRLYQSHEGILPATVTSAIPLDSSAVGALAERLAALTGKRIELREEVDPELLGGIQVRVGDQLIDGSVRGRLERMRTELSNIAI
jgi:F-type H+-transporting ATPase subunit delta